QIFGGLTPYFDPKAFSAPTGAGVFGNTGRDILRGPGYFNLDSSVFRNFQIFGGLTPYFDPKAFSAPTGAGVFGNTGRDILRGPGYFNLDSSVFRNFRITERF